MHITRNIYATYTHNYAMNSAMKAWNRLPHNGEKENIYIILGQQNRQKRKERRPKPAEYKAKQNNIFYIIWMGKETG